MSLPLPRRHLGDYVVRVDGEDMKVGVYVNAELLAAKLARKVARNKSGKTKMVFGAVLVKKVS